MSQRDLKVEVVDMKSRKPQGVAADLGHTLLSQSLICFLKVHARFPLVDSASSLPAGYKGLTLADSAWCLLTGYKGLTSICELQESCKNKKVESTTLQSSECRRTLTSAG